MRARLTSLPGAMSHAPENGSISEMGSHAELLRRRRHYYNLYTRQFRHERELEFDPFKLALPVAV